MFRAFWAVSPAEPAKRPTVFLIVFVERLLGTAGLVIIAGLVTLAGVTLIVPGIVIVAARLSAIASIFPLGVLTMILPVSPAGTGVVTSRSIGSSRSSA